MTTSKPSDGAAEPLLTHELHDFMTQASDEMASEYARIQKRASEDPGTAGDQGEENWAQLLRDWLPPSYRVVTKGRLVGHDNQASPQVDVLVLRPGYPEKLTNKKLYLAHGVAAAFECKTTLKAEHISRAVDAAATTKGILPPREGTPYKELRSPLIFGLLAHSHVWKSPTSDPINNLTTKLDASLRDIKHPRQSIDLVCVADLATFREATCSSYNLAWKAAGTGYVVTTSMLSATAQTSGQAAAFRPIGSFICSLVEKLAWEDPSLRYFADYYRLAGLGGNAGAPMREWPLSVYSGAVAERVTEGAPTSQIGFDEWALMLL